MKWSVTKSIASGSLGGQKHPKQTNKLGSTFETTKKAPISLGSLIKTGIARDAVGLGGYGRLHLSDAKC